MFLYLKEVIPTSYLFFIMVIPHEEQLILTDSKLKDNLLSAFYFFLKRTAFPLK